MWLLASINPGGGVTFAQGGATVVTSDGESYMLGGVTVPKVGNGRNLDLNGSHVVVSSGMTASANGCTISGGSATFGGAILVSKGASVDMTSCVFTGNSATSSGGAVYNNSNTINLTGCTFTGNYSPVYGLAVLNNVGVVHLNGCSFDAGQSVTNTGSGAVTIVSGSCACRGTLNKQGAYGTLLISAGAVINATGNTHTVVIIQSNGGCKVGSGTPDNWVVNGSATFINSAGAEVTLSGTFTSITKDGTVS